MWRRLAPPEFLVVLGAPRSGTSCVSHALHLAGVEFGERLFAPTPANVKGYWEMEPLVRLNDAVLERSGGGFEQPPKTVHWAWWQRWRARRLLRQFSGCRLAGIKDPRLTVTYPLWKPLLGSHRLVACFRHPENVARSLESFNPAWTWDEAGRVDFEKVIRMWKTFNERLLGYANGPVKVYWCNFDEAPDSVERLVGQMAADLDLLNSDPIASYEEELHHHRAPGTDRTRVPGVEALYRSLQAQTAAPQ